MLQSMSVNGITRQVSCIGFIVACAPTLRAACGHKRYSEPSIIRIKHADFPRAGRATAQTRGKAVDRADDGCCDFVGQIGVGCVIGTVQAAQAFFDLSLIGVAVGRDDRAVVKAHHNCRIIFATVRITDQT